MKQYARPPIIEAVIELTYSDKLERRGIEKVAALFSDEYPGQTEHSEVEIRIDKGSVEHSVTAAGVQLADPALQCLVTIAPSILAFSQLAPYPGWMGFFSRAWAVFQRVRQRTGYRQVTRVGTRYVNRIDVPDTVAGLPKLSDYVTTGFNGPPILGMAAPQAYLTQGDFFPPGGWAKAIIRTATTNPALIRHTSVLLDIDVFADTKVPQSEPEMEALLHRMRDLKNAIFEACITERAEALFESAP